MTKKSRIIQECCVYNVYEKVPVNTFRLFHVTKTTLKPSLLRYFKASTYCYSIGGRLSNYQIKDLDIQKPTLVFFKFMDKWLNIRAMIL